VGKAENGKGSVYVVLPGGRAQKVDVQLGMDTGLRVSVLKGLSKDDQVILNPSNDLSEQLEVSPTLWDEAPAP
jgi:HlyD family secretion protein